MTVIDRASTVDVAALDQQIEHVNRLMRSHAGAIEVVSVSAGGVLTVRFVAMCQGCPFRPVTLYAVVLPALEAVPGVTEVRAQGVRVSQEAAERAQAALGTAPWLTG
jgi:Fe-S cluster biogenesis protein NfuA